MKSVIKFSELIWVGAFILAVFGCAPQPVHATQTLKFECSGERIVFRQEQSSLITMEVVGKKDVWSQVPVNGTGKIPFVFFYNLDNGKVAKVGKNYAGKYFVEFYKDVPYSQAHKPEYSTACRIQ